MVVGTPLMNNLNMFVLFDLGVTYSLIARKIVTKIEKGVKVIEKRFIIGTPMGNKIETNSICGSEG
jgi:hypothetical protein